MKQRKFEFERNCSYCGAVIAPRVSAWSEQEGLTMHIECDQCHEEVEEEIRNSAGKDE